MRIMTIASGSSGNCVYVGSDNTHILIDAGISRKRIADGLKELDLTMSDISAIFVTHEHSDHIKGLGVISRKDGIPVISSAGTYDGIVNGGGLGNLPEDLFATMPVDSDVTVGDLNIHSFAISHDANEPFAFRVSDAYKSAGIATDLGYYDDYIIDNLKGCDTLLVEANHDINMLQIGSYPYYLKQRILGNRGHLCNEAAGRLIDSLLHDRLGHIFLGHLSRENNYDKLAYETVRLEIDMSDSYFKSSDFEIEVADREKPSRIITF